MSMKKSLLNSAVKSVGERQIRVIVSDATEDRAEDIVEPGGIDFSNYLKNPVVLYQHDHKRPIARCIELTLTNGQLLALVEFPPEGMVPESDDVYNRIKAGIINAASIGFIPLAWEETSDRSWGLRFTKCEMIEFSFVSVPCNPNALIVERGMSGAKRAGGKLKGKMARLDPDNEENTVMIEMFGLKAGTIISDWIVADGEKKGEHAAAVEFLGGKTDGMVRGIEVSRLIVEGENPQKDEDSGGAAPPENTSEDDEHKALAQELVSILKEGRVISAANETKLRDAHTKIGEVLAQVEEQTQPKAVLGARKFQKELLRLKAAV